MRDACDASHAFLVITGASLRSVSASKLMLEIWRLAFNTDTCFEFVVRLELHLGGGSFASILAFRSGDHDNFGDWAMTKEERKMNAVNAGKTRRI